MSMRATQKNQMAAECSRQGRKAILRGSQRRAFMTKVVI